MDFPAISVITPVYNQVAFIGRAVRSLQLQKTANWELIIVDDGSTDNLSSVIPNLIGDDTRIRYYENERNMGLGYCLNKGIKLAKHNLIAYLPADDIFYCDHLSSLCDALSNDENAILAYSGLLYNYSDSGHASRGQITTGIIEGGTLQLVQVLHKVTAHKWAERDEFVTNDLNIMLWQELSSSGTFTPTSKVTAEWISHPNQRHKIIDELQYSGGIYRYKEYYQVKQPLRFKSKSGHLIDEFEDYKEIEYKVNVSDSTSLKILLVGELAFNPDRICAFEGAGHKLYGLWIKTPRFLNTIGPLPFGNVEDIPADNWQEKVKEVAPDIIYGLLNFNAVSLAHEVMTNCPNIPFVWHFKEGPFICRQAGLWEKLIDLYQKSDGQVFINQENKVWFEQFLICQNPNPFLLDGDLPSKYYFKDKKSKLLSDIDGQVHTVVSGRPFGIELSDLKEMVEQNINLHIYGDISHKTYQYWISQALDIAPDHLHLYHNCPPSKWTHEFSKYDAGWLHVFNSTNEGELMKMDWMDLNYPARMSTLATAGIPMIQKNNDGHIVAAQNIMKKLNMGIFYSSYEELGEQLRDREKMDKIRANCWKQRMYFSFDHHLGEFIEFLRDVIQKKKEYVK